MEKNVMLTPLVSRVEGNLYAESRRWRYGGRCVRIPASGVERRAA
jgi:hypothetical protein